MNVTYGETYDFPTPNKGDGWEFSHWEWIVRNDHGEIEVVEQYIAGSFLAKTGIETMRPVWIRGEDVVYTVEKWYQNTIGIYLKDERLHTGTKGTTVEISGIADGFHLNGEMDNLLSAELVGPGLVLRGYYDRDIYKVTAVLVIDGKENTALGEVDMMYGAELDIGLYSGIPFGYNFVNWYRYPGPPGTPIKNVPLVMDVEKKITLFVEGNPYVYTIIYRQSGVAPSTYTFGDPGININEKKPEHDEGRLFDGWILAGHPLFNGIIDSTFLENEKITAEEPLIFDAVWGHFITVTHPPVGKITVTGADPVDEQEGKYTVSRKNKDVKFSYNHEGTNESVYCWHIDGRSEDGSFYKDATVGVVLKLRAEGIDPENPYQEHSFVKMFNASSEGTYEFGSDVIWDEVLGIEVGGFTVDFSADGGIILHAPNELGTVSIGYIIHQDSSGNYHRVSLTAIIVSGIYPTEET